MQLRKDNGYRLNSCNKWEKVDYGLNSMLEREEREQQDKPFRDKLCELEAKKAAIDRQIGEL